MAPTTHSKNDENRTFGLIMAGGLGALALFRSVWTGSIFIWPIAAAVLLFLTALVVPAWLAPIRTVWMRLAGVLGLINARMLLTLVFALVITPIALLLRLVGKQPIRLVPQPGATSYWHRRNEQEFAPKRMERQF